MALTRIAHHKDVICVLALGILGAGCNSLTKLDAYTVAPSSTTSDTQSVCESNVKCTDEATAAAGAHDPVPAVCVRSTGRCVELLSEDCDTITGDYTSDDIVVLGSLFSTQGAQAATNIQRQQSAQLAVTQINDVGGLPSSSGVPKKLVLVSCDESTDLMRAGDHLVGDLKVPAIVGPNTSQDTLDLSSSVSIPGGTVVMSPTAVASSVGSLLDDDLTWLMVPTDVQRAPLMLGQINALEGELKAQRLTATVKLGIVFRNDALGIGTRTSLNTLVLNGKPLSDAVNLGSNVRIDGYDFSAADQQPIVDAYLAFLPDIVVLAGTAEAITRVMVPLEAAWPASTPRPYYVLIDSVKVPELVTAATGNDDLRQRVRGTGITPSPASASVYDAFKVDYQVAYPGSSIISGMGPAYDATYAIAFALVAENDEEPSGATVKAGLRRLAEGDTEIDIGATRVLSAFQKLASGEPIRARGTFSSLAWTRDGTVQGGTLEVWCIGAAGGKPAYQSSGLSFDIMTSTFNGQYTQCH
jgi:ABC-type branched-subunit amino acid transport system substrate-binding protein